MPEIQLLEGGIKHINSMLATSHGNPDLSNPVGTHGTLQMHLTSDASEIKATIKKRFAREARLPGISIDSDIHFHTIDNDDGTMEVSFEVVTDGS